MLLGDKLLTLFFLLLRQLCSSLWVYRSVYRSMELFRPMPHRMIPRQLTQVHRGRQNFGEESKCSHTLLIKGICSFLESITEKKNVSKPSFISSESLLCVYSQILQLITRIFDGLQYPIGHKVNRAKLSQRVFQKRFCESAIIKH